MLFSAPVYLLPSCLSPPRVPAKQTSCPPLINTALFSPRLFPRRKCPSPSPPHHSPHLCILSTQQKATKSLPVTLEEWHAASAAHPQLRATTLGRYAGHGGASPGPCLAPFLFIFSAFHAIPREKFFRSHSLQ